MNLIEERALENKSEGFIKTTKGNTFEDRVAKTLENKQNIEKWNKESNTGGLHYPLFEKIAMAIGLKQGIKTNVHNLRIRVHGQTGYVPIYFEFISLYCKELLT